MGKTEHKKKQQQHGGDEAAAAAKERLIASRPWLMHFDGRRRRAYQPEGAPGRHPLRRRPVRHRPGVGQPLPRRQEPERRHRRRRDQAPHGPDREGPRPQQAAAHACGSTADGDRRPAGHGGGLGVPVPDDSSRLSYH
ncbi:hypothetical protein OsJ_25149 [Oryza sativa Japonica Group]|uniref:Uncharacterized protein n=1 Tax=Oryza sativa subsp. japonica TaxID=39947 RepID=A3BM91_ORYSJ|nr:hypothetical protein OsJ_25149 [Oryza sativa Japonica Group]